MKIYMYFIMFLLYNCNTNSLTKIVNKKVKYQIVENFLQNGGKLYKKLDTISLKGIEPIYYEVNKPSNSFFGILESEKSISVYYFDCNFKNPLIKIETFYKKNNYYIKWHIIFEEDVSTYFRYITIIKPEKVIVFQYIIFENKEYLHKITFKDKNKKTCYINKSDCYIEFNSEINEVDLVDFEKE